jgi:hypothetical protein
MPGNADMGHDMTTTQRYIIRLANGRRQVRYATSPADARAKVEADGYRVDRVTVDDPTF